MRRLIGLATVVVTIALVAFMLSRLPPPYDTDLSKVGAGQVAAVVVHDHNTVDSIVLMDDLNELRSDYEPALALLIANFHHPDGRGFADLHDLPRASITIFDGQGGQVATYDRHRNRADLVDFLEQHARPLMR
jgi:hypothetical protein